MEQTKGEHQNHQRQKETEKERLSKKRRKVVRTLSVTSIKFNEHGWVHSMNMNTVGDSQ